MEPHDREAGEDAGRGEGRRQEDGRDGDDERDGGEAPAARGDVRDGGEHGLTFAATTKGISLAQPHGRVSAGPGSRPSSVRGEGSDGGAA